MAEGVIDRVYVHSPDRLARKYAYQALLLDEFHSAGVEMVFPNRALSQSPEDELLLHVQGMMAEYERAKILERNPILASSAKREPRSPDVQADAESAQCTWLGSCTRRKALSRCSSLEAQRAPELDPSKRGASESSPGHSPEQHRCLRM